MSDPIQPIRQAVTVAAIASCDCNCKSPDPAMHLAHCRYLKLMVALDACDDAADRIDALEAEVARLRAAKVKPLEWEGDARWPSSAFAPSGIGEYEVAEEDEDDWFLSIPGADGQWHTSEADAKAAAQADYEARVLSALTAPADPQPVTQAEDAAIAGWNACRKSVYAICEDITEKAYAALEGADLTDHEKGFHTGQKLAGKSISRAFGSFEAKDDDNLKAAIALLRPEGGE